MVDKYVYPSRDQLTKAFPDNPRLVKFFEELIAQINRNTTTSNQTNTSYSNNNLLGYMVDNAAESVGELLGSVFVDLPYTTDIPQTVVDLPCTTDIPRTVVDVDIKPEIPQTPYIHQQQDIPQPLYVEHQYNILPPTPQVLGTVADKNYIFSTYTPNISATTGTFTSFNSSGIYTRIGSLVTVSIEIDLVNVGTASGTLFVALPFTARNFRFIGSGRENALTGNMLQTIINPSSSEIRVFTYNNASVISTGALINLTITYFTE